MSDRVICKDCGTVLDDSSGPERKPCPKCGSLIRIFEVEFEDRINIYDSLSYQHKDPKLTGRAKIRSEGFNGYEYSHDRQKMVAKQRLIDREADLYSETVTDIESGEVIHKREEPLSHHKGHGSAKKKLDK